MLRVRNLVRLFIATAALLLIVYGCLFFYYPSTPAFFAAKGYADTSIGVTSKLGRVRQIYVLPFDSTLSLWGTGSGEATFDCVVFGTRSKGRLLLKLSRQSGTWIVNSGTIDGQQLSR